MKAIAKIGLALTAISETASSAPQPRMETAVLAGGCFWGMEAVFEHVKGVENVVSGFAGGVAKDATYAKVSSERTGHAEAIRIVFDPAKVSYFDLLKIYFTVAHDPTQLNRQGPDVGPSYRSAIFPQDEAQRALAERTIATLKSRGKPVVTRIESGAFYPAGSYHQDYVRKHPDSRYVVVNDLPKLAKLQSQYPQFWKR